MTVPSFGRMQFPIQKKAHAKFLFYLSLMGLILTSLIVAHVYVWLVTSYSHMASPLVWGRYDMSLLDGDILTGRGPI